MLAGLSAGAEISCVREIRNVSKSISTNVPVISHPDTFTVNWIRIL
jgi:hypothetical protein